MTPEQIEQWLAKIESIAEQMRRFAAAMPTPEAQRLHEQNAVKEFEHREYIRAVEREDFKRSRDLILRLDEDTAAHREFHRDMTKRQTEAWEQIASALERIADR